MNAFGSEGLKLLESEIAKLEGLLALDHVVLNDLLGKNCRHRICNGLRQARPRADMVSRNAVRASPFTVLNRYCAAGFREGAIPILFCEISPECSRVSLIPLDRELLRCQAGRISADTDPSSS